LSSGMCTNNYINRWLNSNSTPPDGYTSCLRFYTKYKLRMDLFPPPPVFQLEFGQSCTLPFVKASTYDCLD